MIRSVGAGHVDRKGAVLGRQLPRAMWASTKPIIHAHRARGSRAARLVAVRRAGRMRQRAYVLRDHMWNSTLLGQQQCWATRAVRISPRASQPLLGRCCAGRHLPRRVRQSAHHCPRLRYASEPCRRGKSPVEGTCHAQKKLEKEPIMLKKNLLTDPPPQTSARCTRGD